MIQFVLRIFAAITFKAWRAHRTAVKARQRYDAIKAIVCQRHADGFGGTTLSRKKYSLTQVVESFKPPMYMIAKTAAGDIVLCWRKDLMTEEIGPPKENNIREALNRSMKDDEGKEFPTPVVHGFTEV